MQVFVPFVHFFYGTSSVFSETVRAHWDVENRVHWMLDVNFCENAAIGFGIGMWVIKPTHDNKHNRPETMRVELCGMVRG